jgi:type II secretory pathway pseudopilin PulG
VCNSSFGLFWKYQGLPPVRKFRLRAFSLVEVTIALGVMSVSLLTLFALLPVGLKANQSSISQTAATSIIMAVIADMRATPRASATSTQFSITFGSSRTLYFDSEGSPWPALTASSRFRLVVTFPPSPAGSKVATFSDIQVIWPAAAAVGNAQGSCEMFAAFDRN